jgi:hypothetical protein
MSTTLTYAIAFRSDPLPLPQTPFSPGFIEPQDIKIAVVGFDLEITVTFAMPLVYILCYLESPFVKVEALDHFCARVA